MLVQMESPPPPSPTHSHTNPPPSVHSVECSAHLIENAEADSARGVHVLVEESCWKFALHTTIRIMYAQRCVTSGHPTPSCHEATKKLSKLWLAAVHRMIHATMQLEAYVLGYSEDLTG